MKIHDLRGKLPVNPDPKRIPRKRKLSQISTLVLHCTGTGEPSVWRLAKYDVTPNPRHHISPKACPTFTYNFYILKNGIIYYTVDMKKITWHVGNHNSVSVGVCMQYKSDTNSNPPPAKQLLAAETLMTHLCLSLGLTPDHIKGHRELPGTGYKIINGVKKYRKSCPGWHVNMDEFRSIVAKSIQTVLKAFGLYSGKIDGLFGPISQEAFDRYQKGSYNINDNKKLATRSDNA